MIAGEISFNRRGPMLSGPIWDYDATRIRIWY